MKTPEPQPEYKDDPDADLRTFEEFKQEWQCGIDSNPRWCVFGSSPDGDRGVLLWIRPADKDEFAARKLAQMINKLGGEARAEMTEWNEQLTEEPVYKSRQDEIIDNTLSPEE